MASLRSLGWWISCAAAVALVPLGCGALIGIKEVPNPADGGGGGDGTTGPDGTAPDGTLPDGAHPKKDGGGPKTDGDMPDKRTPPPDSPAPDAGGSTAASVYQHHKNISRDGHYIDKLMTPTHAASLVLAKAFDGAIGPGPLWGQPLYVENGIGGKGTYYTADENNNLYALDEIKGKVVKSKIPLAMSAGQTGSGCGNQVLPIGTTGTPIIDPTSRTMYVAPAVGTGSGVMTFQIHALSIDDFSEVAGWPIDVTTIKSAGGASFNPPPQGQRSALALVNGYLYVSWGGENGDCGSYHGWVISVKVTDPTSATGYATSGPGAGMWAVGGLSSDGVDMFGVTGNATGCGSSMWSGCQSEAILRFHDGSAFDDTKTTDFFTPSNWQSLDSGDVDLVGAGPLVLDVPGATPSALVVAMGKSGVMHLLDRSNLGGIGTGDGTNGEGVFSAQVSTGEIRGAAASYTTSTGTYVVFRTDGGGSSCPGGGGDLVAVQITAASPPAINTVWCASSGGSGSPIVTTTDSAGSNPIVWVVGAEGSNQLTGWDGESGTNVYDGGGITMDNVLHWTTLIEQKGRIIVGSNDKVYVFTSTTP
jgi:hypothetical protein